MYIDFDCNVSLQTIEILTFRSIENHKKRRNFLIKSEKILSKSYSDGDNDNGDYLMYIFVTSRNINLN